MPPLPVRQNHNARPRLPNPAGDLKALFPRVLDAPAGNVEGPAPAHAENPGSVVSLARSVFGRSARAHFALGQIEDARALSALRRFQQSAAAGLFRVIAGGSDRQNVERLVIHNRISQGISSREGCWGGAFNFV